LGTGGDRAEPWSAETSSPGFEQLMSTSGFVASTVLEKAPAIDALVDLVCAS
jgi:hypothetical protein